MSNCQQNLLAILVHCPSLSADECFSTSFPIGTRERTKDDDNSCNARTTRPGQQSKVNGITGMGIAIAIVTIFDGSAVTGVEAAVYRHEPSL